MKNTLRRLSWAVLGVVTPTLVHAVAIPPELLQNEGSMRQGFLYGVILVVFTCGIVLGVWLKKRLR